MLVTASQPNMFTCEAGRYCITSNIYVSCSPSILTHVFFSFSAQCIPVKSHIYDKYLHSPVPVLVNMPAQDVILHGFDCSFLVSSCSSKTSIPFQVCVSISSFIQQCSGNSAPVTTRQLFICLQCRPLVLFL